MLLQVTKALIDMENMFELLATEPRVQDEPHAGTLQVSNGTVEFKQVRPVTACSACSGVAKPLCMRVPICHTVSSVVAVQAVLGLQPQRSSQLVLGAFVCWRNSVRDLAAAVAVVQVVFSYNPSPTVQPVLRGLSFLAPGGRSLAVVGSTGSGKSTLLRYAGCAAEGWRGHSAVRTLRTCVPSGLTKQLCRMQSDKRTCAITTMRRWPLLVPLR